MTRQVIKNGQVYRHGHFETVDIVIEDGVFRLFGKGIEDDLAEVIDAEGQLIVPGFFDIHTHGGYHVDFNHASPEDLDKVSHFFASQGTTYAHMSLVTDERSQIEACIDAYNSYSDTSTQLIRGIHLEGPFLSHEYRGSMPAHLLVDFDAKMLEELQRRARGAVHYITLAPEVPGVLEAIPWIRSLGIKVSIGHSAASYDIACQAIEKGAETCTHTFNAMRLFHQHEPAIMGAVLEKDAVYCEAICDGRHLHPGTVRMLLAAKGWDKVIAITDSIMAAGLPDGNYKLGVNDIVVIDGDAQLATEKVRAGSTLTTIQALRNICHYTGESLEKVLPLLTENPARMLGVFDRVGSIDYGKAADMVFLNPELEVQKTLMGGRVVYSIDQ
ncbi:N-acetylglucosamine-6-phosphate deacetylase [Streptococcus plurextorum]|uniref:N-acetylglucosamine-6-phosphate deacetylase n=1 Tax=Streptococcus plurextorum TaxID=456876 RepID=UPI000402FB22|nr:N-acetylglucosamine-6-phosphate deacetylase [Streptococcus plurextorum]